MILKMFTVGFLSTNCYIVGCEKTKEAVIIDPGFSSAEAKQIFKEISRIDLEVKFVVNTHGHVDHIFGNRLVKERTGAQILIHKDDKVMLTDSRLNLSRDLGLAITSPPADQLLLDGAVIEVGQLNLKVVHTPGHTRGSISILVENAVFTGDTLFAGSIGRTDLPGSSFRMIMHSIRDKLMNLPDYMRVYPGHGPTSTIGEERRNNPFIYGFSASQE